MKVRKFQISDAKELSSLIHKTIYTINIKDSPRIAITELEKEYTSESLILISKKRDIYLAIEKNEIIGSIAKENNFIYTFFVKYLMQNKGIGTKLIEFIEHKIKLAKYKEINLMSSLSAIDFFKKMNYIEVKKQIYKGELTGIFMRKILK